MSKFACIACLGWVICLANVCQSSSVQRFVPAAANMPLFGGLKTVEQNNILPSWVPVRPATVSDGSLTGADDSEVWPSLLSNLWQKTEIALFVSPEPARSRPARNAGLNSTATSYITPLYSIPSSMIYNTCYIRCYILVTCRGAT